MTHDKDGEQKRVSQEGNGPLNEGKISQSNLQWRPSLGTVGRWTEI